jgi:YD repeat-containing protein
MMPSLCRSTTDSAGTVTNYDARGKVTSREFTSGNTTTIYDAGGRSVGQVTTAKIEIVEAQRLRMNVKGR